MSKLQKWSVCYQNTTGWKHSCNSYVWASCIQIWVLTRIATDKLSSQEPVPCLQQKCKSDIFFSELQEWLSSEQMDKVWKAYNDNYISLTMDIVRWPRPGCPFAGIMPKKGCKRPIEWPDCEYVWRDHAQLSNSEVAFKSFSNVIDLNPESFNYLNKLFYGKACPNWGMTISKLEGCSHMMCQQCHHEFWWDWLGHFAGYVHEPGAICKLRKLILKAWISICVVLTIFKCLFCSW